MSATGFLLLDTLPRRPLGGIQLSKPPHLAPLEHIEYDLDLIESSLLLALEKNKNSCIDFPKKRKLALGTDGGKLHSDQKRQLKAGRAKRKKFSVFV